MAHVWCGNACWGWDTPTDRAGLTSSLKKSRSLETWPWHQLSLSFVENICDNVNRKRWNCFCWLPAKQNTIVQWNICLFYINWRKGRKKERKKERKKRRKEERKKERQEQRKKENIWQVSSNAWELLSVNLSSWLVLHSGSLQMCHYCSGSLFWENHFGSLCLWMFLVCKKSNYILLPHFHSRTQFGEVSCKVQFQNIWLHNLRPHYFICFLDPNINSFTWVCILHHKAEHHSIHFLLSHCCAVVILDTDLQTEGQVFRILSQ